MARSKRCKNHAVEDTEYEASSHSGATSNSQPNNQNEFPKQLLHALVTMQQTYDLTNFLRAFRCWQLSITVMGPVSSTEEPLVCMTRSDVEPILRKKKEKIFVSSIFIDLKHPYSVDLQLSHIWKDTSFKSSISLIVGKEIHVSTFVRFLNYMEAHPNDSDICLWEFPKSLKGRDYTWYVKLKPR